jgi:hypothetical protein
MTCAEYNHAFVQARRKAARLVIQGKADIRKEYARLIADIGAVVKEHRDASNLEALIRAAISKERLYMFMAQTMRDGIVMGTRSITDIDKRYLFDKLNKAGVWKKMSKKKIEALYDKMALDRVKEEDAIIDRYRYTNTGDADDWIQNILGGKDGSKSNE